MERLEKARVRVVHREVIRSLVVSASDILLWCLLRVTQRSPGKDLWALRRLALAAQRVFFGGQISRCHVLHDRRFTFRGQAVLCRAEMLRFLCLEHSFVNKL